MKRSTVRRKLLANLRKARAALVRKFRSRRHHRVHHRRHR
jgi:hypothetical protein